MMVKCGNCGVEVSESFDLCPNCGSDLKSSSQDTVSSSNNVCSNCGSDVPEGVNFCPDCGNKIDLENINKCKQCGAELLENVLFCPICGNKADNIKKKKDIFCPNCGTKMDNDALFCDECGTNIKTGMSTNNSKHYTNNNSMGNIDLFSILIPSILCLIASIILSLIGLFIGLSQYSFILAIVLSVGFFAGTIDNENNALISGVVVGFILGLLEFTLVDVMFGKYVAVAYEWFLGSNIIILVILGAIIGYVSNKYFKENIREIINNLGISWL